MLNYLGGLAQRPIEHGLTVMKTDTYISNTGKHKGGFTLTEVLVASTLLIIAVTAVFSACTVAIRTQYMSSNYYHATCLARNRIQRGLSLPFETLPVLEESDQPVDQDGNANTVGPYKRTTTMTKQSDDCYKVTVTVSYPTGKGDISKTPVKIESKIARKMYSEEISE